jgi:hypothetical protein
MTIMREDRRAGYKIFLVYVALKDPELHIERVRLRVSRGGHDIPDADILRRYARSLMRAPEALAPAERQLCSTTRASIPFGCSSSQRGGRRLARGSAAGTDPAIVPLSGTATVMEWLRASSDMPTYRE